MPIGIGTGLAIGAGVLSGANLVKDIWSMGLQKGIKDKELSLQEKLMQSQLAGLTTANEANQLAAAEYMGLLKEEKAESRKSKNRDRRMQLMMMMLSGVQGIQNQSAANQLQSDIGPPPPTSMMALLGGR